MRRTTIDWAAVQDFHEEGHSCRECMARFGFAAASWTQAVRRGALKSRGPFKPLDQLLATSKSRTSIKRRLLMAGILENRCDQCGLSEWRGRPLSIQIDHRNGIRDDHRVENLRMLCPNRHSQTETFGTRNWKNTRQSN